MDIFIKMCNCPDIQGIWEPSAWDYCFCKKDNEVVVLSGYETDAGFYGHSITFDCGETLSEFKGRHIWLPTQSQLQGMVLGSDLPDEFCKVIGYFYDFVLSVTPQFDSMEQLWLAFVRKVKYGKIWSGEEWENEGR